MIVPAFAPRRGGGRKDERAFADVASFLLPSMLSRSELSLYIKLLNGFQYRHFFCFFSISASQMACVIFFCHLKLNEHKNIFFLFFRGKKSILTFVKQAYIFHHLWRRMSYDFISRRRHRCYCRCHHLNMVRFFFIWFSQSDCVCEWVLGPPNFKAVPLKKSFIMMQNEFDTQTHADFSL